MIDGAIEKISSMRAELGAVENRLSHTVSNLMNVAENTASARSRINDADYSIESANLAIAVNSSVVAENAPQPLTENLNLHPESIDSRHKGLNDAANSASTAVRGSNRLRERVVGLFG